MSKGNFTRRNMLKTGVATGAALAVPTIYTSKVWADGHTGFTNAPGPDSVTLGFNVPQTGAYADEGADELRAFQLAVQHINGEGDGGMLNTFSSSALDGTGILGRRVEYVTGDTQTSSDAARSSARSMIERDGAIMISGGSSSGVAIAVQGLCQDAGVIFMAGLTHSNDTTGKDRRANGFRHFFNTEQSGRALAPILEAAFGTDRRAYHLTADYTWGWSQQGSMQTYTEAMGWETTNTVLTPVGAGDFSSYITPVANSGADLLILNHYGGDMVNSLTQAVQFGLRDLQVDGVNFEIVVPLYSELMARGAGSNIVGIFGSQNWDWKIENERGDRYAGTNAFVQSFGQAYGFPPSQAAQTCYAQTMLYADAVARGGSFNPCSVAEALEGFEFDGLGNGPTLYRAADHQCFKDVVVVRGKENPENEFDLVEIVDITSAEDAMYAEDHPDFAGGDLGTCNPGA